MADLMTVAKALAFVDELVLLDDDCTRPELAMRVLAAEVRRLQDRESTLQASVMAHKTWEDEAVGQANNANLAYNKMRVERDALKAEVERLTRERDDERAKREAIEETVCYEGVFRQHHSGVATREPSIEKIRTILEGRAAAVEAAFREGWSRKAGMPRGIDCGYEIDAAWAASTARQESVR